MPEGTRRAPWAEVIRHARCAREATDPDLWFPVSANPAGARREAAEAVAICRTCPVQEQCLELSLRHWEIGRHGVWGGLLPAERADLRRLLPMEQAGSPGRLEESA
jgi:WhiB family redox-sensing transcriptional regulator